MGKMLYSAAISLDGFITGNGGDASWLTECLGPNPTVDEVVGQIGALLVGNRTFRGDDPHKGTPIPSAPSLTASAALDDPPISFTTWCAI